MTQNLKIGDNAMSCYVRFEGHRMTSEGHKDPRSRSEIFSIFVYQRRIGGFSTMDLQTRRLFLHGKSAFRTDRLGKEKKGRYEERCSWSRPLPP